MGTKTDLLTPVGRLVEGSLYRGNELDGDGKPLVVKSGPNIGQPRKDFFFGIAIKKEGEVHWRETTWGAKIWAAGQTGMPAQAQSPGFAWKVRDGDSTVANKKGNRPCDKEGFPGHWIISFSSGFAPKVYGDAGATLFTEEGRVKLGHFVQVFGSVGSNDSTQNPGVFINHSMVCFIDFGPEISVGQDAKSVGFAAQKGAMPASSPFQPAPLAVSPNPAFLAPPPAPVAAHVMTAAANGGTYEQYVAAGWTDVQLVQNGMMVA